jgi:hypothetical protein
VKAEEQKYSIQMRQLESQLQAALLAAEQQQLHGDTNTPLIDVDSAAEKTLQLLDRMLEVRNDEKVLGVTIFSGSSGY